MALFPKTPGVYVQEISTLPPSIAPLSTAVPGFMGYTEKTIINGAQWDYTNDGPAPAVRITSLPEFTAAFGGAFKELYEVDIDLSGNPSVTPKSDSTNDTLSPYSFYFHLQMYFANGGGPCHVISVGNYDYSSGTPTLIATDFYDPGDATVGIGQAELVDEITLLVAPEVADLTAGTDPDADIKGIYDAMLSQCNKLKDRFSILDVKKVSGNTPFDDGNDFRNNNVGANNLKYGGSYYPPLNTTLSRNYSDDDVTITSDTRVVTDPYDSPPNNRLSTILQGIGDYTSFEVTSGPTASDTLTIVVLSTTVVLTAGVDFTGAGTDANIAASIVRAVNNHAVLSLVARAQLDDATPEIVFIVTRSGTSDIGDLTVTPTGTWTTPPGPGALTTLPGVDNSQDTGLYNKIKEAIAELNKLTLVPSAAMAGIYATVDNDRGVWKAPANVSVASIFGPSVIVTESQQSDLNVDATSGKSINVIRSFVGRGTLVWGSRTLDGNSNEWRYVPVRRLFIFAEESIKKATEFVVFEPNDKNTWLRVKSMISNFLSDLWKQGALTGDKPEQAYFVSVGLGETMTPQDILEGKMIIRIGLAAVRPAEFIILQFEHKLQEA
jgi:phage tail sheath protein FI